MDDKDKNKERRFEERKNLGRGLEAIFLDLTTQPVPQQGKPNVVAVELPLGQIKPNPDQPRKFFDAERMEELKQSLAKEGVLQPLLVRRMQTGSGDGAIEYQIIAGERRWRAAESLGIEKIPAIILECDNQTALQLGLIENLQREELSPLEEAQAIHSLVTDFDRTQEDVAKMLSKSRSYIANALRILKLPEAVKDMLQKKEITVGHARAILEAFDPEAMAKKIIGEKLSVREVEQEMREKAQKPWGDPLPRSSRISNPDIETIEEVFSKYFHTSVKVALRGEGGIIQVFFKNYNKLEEIMGLF
ncbi:chromosome-partitioning protein ParB [Alphaproteobacteria bacterium]|nr:chromosome-partitioning protein ParB [Alphaproteobacteria bacterium]GHS96601.1 chromosome-partitioning protein ParB [Alphaproteobacteria bacterium]